MKLSTKLKNSIRSTFLSVLLILNFAGLEAQEVTGDTLDKINLIFKNWDTKTSPGAALAISRHGKLIYNLAWGMANIEDQITNTTSTIFDAASITKQFTAAGILLLESKKKLSLDDDVRKYLPELPILKKPVSIRNLMHHTSGLREWSTTLILTGWERGTGSFGNERILEFLTKQKELVHKPGEEFNYVNSNYNLLAIIIERVSRMQLSEFYKKNVFAPLGLTNTYWNDFTKRPNAAFGYTNNSGTFRKENPTLRGLGPGGILTTPSDLLRWNNKYLSGELGGQQLLKRQLQQGSLNNAVTTPYAAGLSISNYQGHKTIFHDGQGTGYTSFTESYPDLGLSFALMSNVSTLDAVNICRQVEALFVPHITSEATDINIPVVNLSIEQLMRFTGWYKNTRTSAGLFLTVKENFLISNNGDTLQAISPVKFKMRGNILEFPDTVRSTAQLINTNFYPDTVLMQPVSPPEYDIKTLAKYVGEYFSDELGSNLVVLSKNDSLYLQLPGGKMYKLKPLYEDGFISEPSIVATSPTYIVYEHKNGLISGMRVSLYRSRNNFFKKTK